MLTLRFAYWIISIFLIIKILINLALPFALFRKIDKGGEKRSVSLLLELDIALLTGLLTCGYFIKTEGFFYTPSFTIKIFGSAALSSYIMAFIGGNIFGYLKERNTKKQ